MKSPFKSLSLYIRQIKKENLIAGLLACTSGGILVILGLLLIINLAFSSFSGSTALGALPFEKADANFAVSLLLFAAAIPAFLAGFLLFEESRTGTNNAAIPGRDRAAEIEEKRCEGEKCY